MLLHSICITYKKQAFAHVVSDKTRKSAKLEDDIFLNNNFSAETIFQSRKGHFP